jgi:alkyl hydroperoxide reductase subunit AhpC
LADFQERLSDFEQRATTIVAASVDSLEDATTMRDDQEITFPIGHSLDMNDVARRYGAFFNPDREILHATGFVVNEDGTVGHAVYATGPIGRLDVTGSLRAIDYMISQAG